MQHDSPILQNGRGKYDPGDVRNMNEEMLHREFEQLKHKIALYIEGLSPAERNVSALLLLDLPSMKIADLLNITEGTVNNHRRNIRKKLGLKKENLQNFLMKELELKENEKLVRNQ